MQTWTFFQENLLEIIDKIAARNTNLILLGDFNIDLIKVNSHNKTNAFIEEFFSRGLSPLITKPTRITDYSATLIDHIHTNINNKNVIPGIIITDVSDHCGIFSIFKNGRKKTKHKPALYRSFCPNNIQMFKNTISNIDFVNVLNTDDPDTSYNNFMIKLHSVFEATFPLINAHRNNKKKKRNEWMTNGSIVSSNMKNMLYLKKLKKATEENNTKYKLYCKIYNKLLIQ